MAVPAVGPYQEDSVSTIALLLAGLLSAADAPARGPAAADAPFGVAIGPAIRIGVPSLGPPRPADAQERKQVFEFYIGFFR
jgi:hypothetical protein